MSVAAARCPACCATDAFRHLETSLDAVASREYRIYLCAQCEVVFSEPRAAVGPDWYEKAAPIRVLESHPRADRDWRFRTFLREPFPRGKLLDVGCGDGGFLLLAKEAGYTACGFDYEQRMIDLARSRGILDAEAAEFSEYCKRRLEDEFAVITLFDVLEHTPEPAILLTQLKRLLQRGGLLVITLPNALRPIVIRREEHDYPPSHFTRWTPAALSSFLQRNGFSIVRLKTRMRLRYYSDNLFFNLLMPAVLRTAKRILFGTRAGTLSELYQKPQKTEPGATGRTPGGKGRLHLFLADKWQRQKLVNGLKIFCLPLTLPPAIALAAYALATRGFPGDHLYMVAQLEKK